MSRAFVCEAETMRGADIFLWIAKFPFNAKFESWSKIYIVLEILWFKCKMRLIAGDMNFA